MSMQFNKATKKQTKLRLGMAGPSNAGKTLGALMIAKGIGEKIAVIDTERGSASLYSTSFDFDTLELQPPYSPERFIEAIRAAEKAGYGSIIVDSLTHEWDGTGGCLEINETIAQAKYRGNTWSAWSETTPRHRSLLDAILQSPSHIIATMRSKTETVQGEDKKVRKVGMKTEQRGGTEYEMTMMLEMEHSTHFAVLTKGRLFDAPAEVRQYFETPHLITPTDGQMLMRWLEQGEVARLSDGEAADHKAAIEAASDIDSLQKVFGTAYTQAKRIQDGARMDEFQKAYEARKAALATKAQVAA